VIAPTSEAEHRPSDIERIQALRVAGLCLSEIAAELSTSERTWTVCAVARQILLAAAARASTLEAKS